MRHPIFIVSIVCCVVLATGCADPPRTGDGQPWITLEAGLELGEFPVSDGADREHSIRVLRIDPQLFDLKLINASARDGNLRSTREWSESEGLVAAINAGMYQEDYSTSVSLMRTRDHVNNSHLTRHKAILAFDPLDPSDPPVTIIDLECEKYQDWKERYETQIQSIRMLSCRGENVWQSGSEPWSTAAFGLDRQARTLLIHVRVPLGTHDLIERLRELPIELDRLMYAEGGPQAQLFVRGPQTEYEFVGSINVAQALEGGRLAWPVPNVLGVVRRKPDATVGTGAMPP